MKRSFKTRLVRGSASLALLSCLAQSAGAQDTAPAPDLPVSGPVVAETATQATPEVPALSRESEGLPGIPDIDFSLEGETSDTATPALPQAQPVDSPPAPATAGDAETQSGIPQSDRPPDRTAVSRAAAPAAQPSATSGGDASAASAPTKLPDTSSPTAAVIGNQDLDQSSRETDAALTEVGSNGTYVALGLLLALAALGGVAFLATRFRRERTQAPELPVSANTGAREAPRAPHVEMDGVDDTRPPEPAEASERPPVAADSARPAARVPPLREADPALRTRIPLPGQAEVRPAVEPKPRKIPSPAPRTSLTRYDKFGLPIPAEGTKPSPAQPAPPSPEPDAARTGRRRGPVRYDVMGLPIFE